jgi:predicted ester cyclase
MSTEENKATVRRYWEGFNAHNLDVWDEVCTPNHINHDPSLPTPDADLQTIKQIIGGLQAAFPDLNSSEEDLISEGDKIVVRRTFRGTHKGEFMGVAASGNEVSFTGIFIDRLTGGKIEEQWAVFDALGLLQQIGAVPPPGQGGG